MLPDNAHAMPSPSRRWAAALVILAVSAAAWGYVLTGAGTGMSVWAMTTVAFPPPRPALIMAASWSPGYAAVMFGMWTSMMVAMMLPVALLPLLGVRAGMFHALPFLLSHPAPASAAASAAVYGAGALLPWVGFSALATALQYALEQAGLLDGLRMWSVSAALSATLLAIAGLYQATAIKRRAHAACCPAMVATAEPAGPLALGLAHGWRCTVRCTPMMLLLFAGGIMNVIWIAGLSLLSAAEALDSRRWVANAAGIGFLALAVVAAGHLL